ncbi:MAG: hypothetical protein J6C55_01890 [Oscillospiraceae bacterium]|nr:hypothetical protein [Oscillospiraceae bacterium]
MNIKIYKNHDILNILKPTDNIYYSYDESDEIAISFAMSLKIPKKSFVLDKTIGSDFLKKVQQLYYKDLKSNLIYLLNEVASSFQLINIKNVEYSIEQKSNCLFLFITIEVLNNTYLINLEVFI